MSTALPGAPPCVDSIRASSPRSARSSEFSRITAGFCSVAEVRSTFSCTSRSVICARTSAAPVISASACLSRTMTPDFSCTACSVCSALTRFSLVSCSCFSKKTRRSCASETASRPSSLVTSASCALARSAANCGSLSSTSTLMTPLFLSDGDADVVGQHLAQGFEGVDVVVRLQVEAIGEGALHAVALQERDVELVGRLRREAAGEAAAERAERRERCGRAAPAAAASPARATSCARCRPAAAATRRSNDDDRGHGGDGARSAPSSRRAR